MSSTPSRSGSVRANPIKRKERRCFFGFLSLRSGIAINSITTIVIKSVYLGAWIRSYNSNPITQGEDGILMDYYDIYSQFVPLYAVIYESYCAMTVSTRMLYWESAVKFGPHYALTLGYATTGDSAVLNNVSFSGKKTSACIYILVSVADFTYRAWLNETYRDHTRYLRRIRPEERRRRSW